MSQRCVRQPFWDAATTTVPDTTAPAAPTGLAADNSGINTVISGAAEPNSKKS
ncbi:hypothetical protein INT80_04205 [Gallibacterium anatis]|uniref:Uncharacterized protein n=1 Tax=Gallibacterium anatis TaxID=750 RepID=A0A930UR19_9PAST|nr:hypothetical protein [Gallibacterium anatis]